jgi:hypothetical protein
MGAVPIAVAAAVVLGASVGRDLLARFGAERRRWRAAGPRNSHAPLLSASMRSTNRPTFQQVLTFGGHR